MARIDRVNELIKREISNMILKGEISDPRIALVTILSVDVSKDLHHARVRYSVLSDDPVIIQQSQQGLDSCSGYVRRLVGQRVELRYTPEVQFIYDRGIQYAAKIDQLLNEIKTKEKPDSQMQGDE